jgi:hypothetical protein
MGIKTLSLLLAKPVADVCGVYGAGGELCDEREVKAEFVAQQDPSV